MEEFKGSALAGCEYEPLFPYFQDKACNGKEYGAFKVINDSYVTDDSGTGVVHCAPAFGEDDYRVCILNKVIKKGEGESHARTACTHTHLSGLCSVFPSLP